MLDRVAGPTRRPPCWPCEQKTPPRAARLRAHAAPGIVVDEQNFRHVRTPFRPKGAHPNRYEPVLPEFPNLSGLLRVVAGEDFTLRHQPVLVFAAGRASPLLVQFVSAAADFSFQFKGRRAC